MCAGRFSCHWGPVPAEAARRCQAFRTESFVPVGSVSVRRPRLPRAGLLVLEQVAVTARLERQRELGTLASV